MKKNHGYVGMWCKNRRKRPHTLSDHIFDHRDEWDAKFRGDFGDALVIPQEWEQTVLDEWKGALTGWDKDYMAIRNQAAMDLSPLLIVPSARFPSP